MRGVANRVTLLPSPANQGEGGVVQTGQGSLTEGRKLNLAPNGWGGSPADEGQ